MCQFYFLHHPQVPTDVNQTNSSARVLRAQKETEGKTPARPTAASSCRHASVCWRNFRRKAQKHYTKRQNSTVFQANTKCQVSDFGKATRSDAVQCQGYCSALKDAHKQQAAEAADLPVLQTYFADQQQWLLAKTSSRLMYLHFKSCNYSKDRRRKNSISTLPSDL